MLVYISHPARMNEFKFTYLHVPHRFKMYFFFVYAKVHNITQYTKFNISWNISALYK